MARTKGSGNKKKSGKDQFKACNPVDKKICYNYWIFLDSEGTRGWDIALAGRVDHYEQFDDIRDVYTKREFYYKGKRMADIARLLKAEGLILERENNDTPAIALQRTRFAEARASSDESSNGESESEEEDNDTPEKPKMAKTPPKSAMKKPGKKLEEKFKGLSVNGPVQTVTGQLPMAMLSGRWTHYDYDTDHEEAFVLMRMLIHNGCNENDFQLSWIDSKHMRLRLCWPLFMRKVMMMTHLDQIDVPDGNGGTTKQDVFPSHHEVYKSMARNAKAMKDVDKNVYSEGIFEFENHMKMGKDDMSIDLFTSNVSIEGRDEELVSILQIRFKEADEEEKEAPLSIQKKKAADIKDDSMSV